MAVLEIEPMIANGGWPSVYYNRIGWAVPIAVRGYTIVGAIQHGALASAAMSAVLGAEESHPSTPQDTDEWFSTVLMGAVGDEVWDRLDDGWMQAQKSEDVYDLLGRYITNHRL
jgi:hypothetical protein